VGLRLRWLWAEQATLRGVELDRSGWAWAMLGCRLIDRQSQNMMVAARATADRKVFDPTV
jgi:hypothetical protein